MESTASVESTRPCNRRVKLKGKLVVVEGIDVSGKYTIRLLVTIDGTSGIEEYQYLVRKKLTELILESRSTAVSKGTVQI